MPDITGLVTETTAETVDPIATTGGATKYKQAKGPKAATGLDSEVAAQVVAFDSSTATLANVSGSASSVTLIALNLARVGATIDNDSAAVLYVKCGSTASATSYTWKVQPGDSLEVPFGYTGILTGIWASATGAARCTEFVA